MTGDDVYMTSYIHQNFSNKKKSADDALMPSLKHFRKRQQYHFGLKDFD